MTTIKQHAFSLVSQAVLAIAALGAAGGALAIPIASSTVLTGEIIVDNGYSVYLSTSDSVQGTLFGSLNDWYTTGVNTVSLTAGVNYFLHVYGYDQGGIAGFLGEFTLSGATHQFANGSTSLLTNTTDWLGNATGFNGSYNALTDLGVNGVGPWGSRAAVPSTAHWIWSGNADSNDTSYFTARINAVPEPVSLALFGIGLVGLVATRRGKAANTKA